MKKQLLLFVVCFFLVLKGHGQSFVSGSTGFVANYLLGDPYTSCLKNFDSTNGGAAYVGGNVVKTYLNQNIPLLITSSGTADYTNTVPYYLDFFTVRGEGMTATCEPMSGGFSGTNSTSYIDLSGNSKVFLYAKANAPTSMEFYLGYANKGYPDVSSYANGIVKSIALTTETTVYEIDFSDWMHRDSVNVFGIFIHDANITVSIEKIELGDVSRIHYNHLQGKLYTDTNDDCAFQSGDNGIANVLMQANTGQLLYLSYTDKDGNYDFGVDSGSVTYTISPLFNERTQALISTVCSPTLVVNTTGSSTIFCCSDFAIQGKSCSALSVEINSDRRRRCFRNNTWVSYTNLGLLTANDAVVKVIYPKYVVPISSVPAWSSTSGDTLIYQVGTINAGDNGQIHLVDSVVCGMEEIRGIDQCTEAIISPRSECTPILPSWDGSSITVEAICLDSTALFLIRNTGDNMTGSSDYRLYANDTLIYTSTFQLTAGTVLELAYSSTNASLRLEADQRPFYPEPSMPRAFLDGCGVNTSLPVQSYVFCSPQDDLAEFIAISCLEILDSYDPNDKKGLPQGYSDEHLIKAGQRLQYTIRFQNTGSDIAYRVKVVDTLDTNLDVVSFTEASSSHPYSLAVSNSPEGKAFLTFTFNNINLEDSTVNEPKSNGFVSFYINAKEGLADGTNIHNQANIFFDYNSAIVTNTVNHTIGAYTASDFSKGNSVQIVTGVLGQQKVDIQNLVNVYPNPASDAVQVELQQATTAEMEITDLSGAVKWSGELNNKITSVSLSKFSSGMYVYKIQSNGAWIGAGKLLVK